MPTICIIGATQGLGASLVDEYNKDKTNKIFATSRWSKTPESTASIHYVPDIDVASKSAGSSLASKLKSVSSGPLDIVIITAGYFSTESLKEPDWDAEVKMYTISSIAPVFLVHHLAAEDLIKEGSKIILVSSESGSITLRHESEGGGNYGHHASKSALNMVGKLLSLDLKEKGVSVGILHPAFMRTEMTKGVGFDKFWDAGGAVTPDVAAKSFIEFVEKFDIKMTGQYWAPRGPGDIGTAEAVLGPIKDLPTPLQLPW